MDIDSQWLPEDDVELLQLADLVAEDGTVKMIDWEEFKRLIGE